MSSDGLPANDEETERLSSDVEVVEEATEVDDILQAAGPAPSQPQPPPQPIPLKGPAKVSGKPFTISFHL